MATWFGKITTLEDEIVQLLADSSTEALRAVPSGSIQKGIRLLTEYAGLSAFPYVEVAWAEETFEVGTQQAEHTVAVDVAAIVKASKPRDGIEKTKALFGACYDVLIAKPDLDCGADILPDGRVALMPATLMARTQTWLYGTVGTFNYHLRF